jgi:hypothetical protein
MNRKPANMGIAGVEPHQLAPTVGTMGSRSTDSPDPSPIVDNLIASTRLDGPASAMTIDSASLLGVDSVINFDTNDKIDIDFAINTAVGIAAPAVTNTNDKINIDFAIDTAIGIAAPAITNTNDKIDIDTAIGIAVPAVTDTNNKIDIDSAIDTAVGIAVPNVISTSSLEPEVDITGSTVIDTASPSAADLIPAAIIIDPTSSTTGAVSATTGGFDMAFGLFKFHMDNDGVAE